MVTFNDIKVFESQKGKGRGSNDKNNNLREEILLLLVSLPPNLTDYPEWVSLSSKFRSCLDSLVKSRYEGNFDTIKLKKKAGRGHNHDYVLTAYLASAPVFSTSIEFKHNAKNVSKLPEYLSVAADRFVPELYAQNFYDTYLPRICELSPTLPHLLPTWETYKKFIHQNSEKKDPFFVELRNLENSDKEFYKKKSRIVNESITAFLTKHKNDIDMARMNTDIQTSQKEKIFILWTLKDFVIDTITADELTLTHCSSIKNGNKYVMDTLKPGTQHHLLLRWKNHIGILFPAWQISLTRSARIPQSQI